MLLHVTTAMLALLVAAQAAPANAAAAHEKRGLSHRANLYRARVAETSERIKRAQHDVHHPKQKHPNQKRGASVTFTSTSTSSAASPAYTGRQADTSACSNQAVSDGCTDPVYIPSASSVDLSNGGTIQPNGHINFQYIPYSQYQGSGSYRAKPSNWSPVSCGMHFDPLNNQPGGAYIGKSSFPYLAACALPSTGYCIIWVQYSDANQHYGEGGQGPVCFPGTSGGGATTTGLSSSTGASNTSKPATATSTSSTSPTSSPTTKTSTSTSTTSSAAATGTRRLWDQCGGNGYVGSGCVSGLTCTYMNDYYSQCLSPQCANSYGSQCGGQGYGGTTCCAAPQKCVVVNQWYSQCQG